jgi:hypothetical protein
MKTFSQRLVYAWRHLHWRNLRKFARSKVVQSAAVFPFIGYFALINQKTASLLKPPETLAALFLLSPQRELFLVYFGVFLIGAGVVVYNLRCPFVIKHFENENACAQFYAMLIGVFGLPDESPNPIHREIARRYDEFNRDPEAWQKFLSTRREEVFGFYVKWYGSQDSDNPASRAACSACLALGFLFLAIPSIDTFIAVSRAVL